MFAALWKKDGDAFCKIFLIEFLLGHFSKAGVPNRHRSNIGPKVRITLNLKDIRLFLWLLRVLGYELSSLLHHVILMRAIHHIILHLPKKWMQFHGREIEFKFLGAKEIAELLLAQDHVQHAEEGAEDDDDGHFQQVPRNR